MPITGLLAMFTLFSTTFSRVLSACLGAPLSTLSISTALTRRMALSVMALLMTIGSLNAWADKPQWPQVKELGFQEKRHLEVQAQQIDELLRKAGNQLHNDKSDLELLQRIVYKGLVKKDQRLLQQSMGVVLGNVFLTESKHLQWMTYQDKLGKSRAVCITGTQHCLFPITMLSRRMEVGLLPDVDKIYREAWQMIESYLPVGPYGLKE